LKKEQGQIERMKWEKKLIVKINKKLETTIYIFTQIERKQGWK
jgi:hypothetical protein